jgi:condensin complex subunit 2
LFCYTAADGGAIPFNTQFFHDDYDDGPGFDDVYEGDGGAPDIDAGEQDLLAATQGQTRRVRPEFVNYAKRAKRVDVRKLKENIWKGLGITLPPSEDNNRMVRRAYFLPSQYANSRRVKDTDDPHSDPAEARVFGSVISGLQKSYPREKMEEISTSFCFICLLHLANEQGLKIESSTEGLVGCVLEVEQGGGDVADKKVGDIWDLKVRPASYWHQMCFDLAILVGLQRSECYSCLVMLDRRLTHYFIDHSYIFLLIVLLAGRVDHI